MAQESPGGVSGKPQPGPDGGGFGQPQPGVPDPNPPFVNQPDINPLDPNAPDPNAPDPNAPDPNVIDPTDPKNAGGCGTYVIIAIGLLTLFLTGVAWDWHDIRAAVFPVPVASNQSAAPSPATTRPCRYVFADHQFAESDWVYATIYDPASSQSGAPRYDVESSVTPLPGERMRVTRINPERLYQLHPIHSDSIEVWDDQRAGVYDPGACGRASSIDASYSLENRGSMNYPQDVSFLVSQGGYLYVAGKRAANTNYFDHVDLKGLHETDFVRLGGLGPLHPDFSRGQLKFGYLTSLQCANTPSTLECDSDTWTSSALMDWSVTVHH